MILCARVFQHDVAIILVPFLCYTSTGNGNCGPCAVSAGLCSAVCVVLFTWRQACWPGFQPCCVPQLSSRRPVQCQWIIHHPYHTTPTTSHRHYTRQDLLDIGAASSSSAGPLSPLLITHLRHLGLACNQPRKPRRGGRNELLKINVRVNGSDRPLHRPPVHSISTQPDHQHHSSHPDTTTARVTDAKLHFSSYSHHQKQGNLIHINPNQNNNGPTVTVFNTKSVGPKESK